MKTVMKAVRPLALGAALFALSADDVSAQDVRMYGNAACFGLGCGNPLTPDLVFREVALTGNLSPNSKPGAFLVNFAGWNGLSPWFRFDDGWSNQDHDGEMRMTGYTRIRWDGKNDHNGDIELPRVTATPEPVSMLLMASGLAGVAAIGRRRKQGN